MILCKQIFAMLQTMMFANYAEGQCPNLNHKEGLIPDCRVC